MLAENIDRWKEAFINQGRTSGKIEGELEGERKLLIKQLNRRFSNVPTWALDQINAADANLLETWALRLFDVNTIEELFA